MKIGYIGLGKMGQNMVLNLLEHKIDVVAWNRSQEPLDVVRRYGAETVNDLSSLVRALSLPRVIWIMLPQGRLIDDFIDKLIPLVSSGDVIIDGGNSFYKDSVMRFKRLKDNGIHFMDVGTSGGPDGARRGACLMIGGNESDYQFLVPLWQAVAAKGGYKYLGKSGAGHFAKMIHNGIEYGMMEAIAEGADLLYRSEFQYNLGELFSLYDHQSVISSRLVGWAEKALAHDQNLSDISSVISHTGEGDWTVNVAKEMNASIPVISASLQVRIGSANEPDNFRNRVVSALRGQFGRHEVNK